MDLARPDLEIDAVYGGDGAEATQGYDVAHGDDGESTGGGEGRRQQCPSHVVDGEADGLVYLHTPVPFLAETVRSHLADALGPPYSNTKALQIADLVPLAEACFLGGGLVAGVSGAALGYSLCGVAEASVGALAAIATQAQIAKSECGAARQVVATAINLVNFRLDFGLPLGDLVEFGAYLATSELLACVGKE